MRVFLKCFLFVMLPFQAFCQHNARTQNLSFSDLNISLKDMSGMIKFRLDQFARCIMVLGSSPSDNDKKEQMKVGMAIFHNDEKVIVSVKRLNSAKPVPHRIREYYTRVMSMKFDHVEVSYNDVQFISNIHKGDDGVFRGSYSVMQEFKGYDKDGNLIYHTYTKRDGEFIIPTAEVDTDGGTTIKWKIFLGNLMVENERVITR